MISVSIVVPVLNEGDRIPDLFACLKSQTYNDGPLECIIVDGGSTDNTIWSIEQHIQKNKDTADISGIAHSYSLLRNPSRWVSNSMNMGINTATGDVIIRMDAHSEYASDYVSECVAALVDGDAINVGGPARTKATGYLQRSIAAAYHSPFSVGGARFHDPEYEGYVDTVTYGCWWKKTLLDLGGFDENLVRNQDDELNLRIIRAGGKIYQTPRIRSWYYPRSKLSALFRQYLQYGFWKVRVIRKHRLPASPRHLVPVLFVLGLIIGAVSSAIVPQVFLIYLSVLLLYGLLLSYYSLHAALKFGWDLLPVLPATFAVYHLSYGIGFLVGLLDQFRPRRRQKSAEIFSTLSR